MPVFLYHCNAVKFVIFTSVVLFLSLKLNAGLNKFEQPFFIYNAVTWFILIVPNYNLLKVFIPCLKFFLG